MYVVIFCAWYTAVCGGNVCLYDVQIIRNVLLRTHTRAYRHTNLSKSH